MDTNYKMDSVITKTKDGGEAVQQTADAPSAGKVVKQLSEESAKRKRRRGKSKRKILKPFTKVTWQNRRKNEKSKRNGFRKIVLRKTHAPYNNNQFLMEIHKPEPENSIIMQTPSARTRDSSFSVDSEENTYFYALPADEEEFLTKEFSSVYEDAQCERLASMSKNELIQEYLMLEAKYDKLLGKCNEDKNATDTTATDAESMSTDRDTTGTSIELSMIDRSTTQEIVQHVKEQEEQMREMKIEIDKLRLENAHLRKQTYHSSSADSESDSSSTSVSCSSSSSSDNSRRSSPSPLQGVLQHAEEQQQVHENGMAEVIENGVVCPLVNGYHNGSNTPKADDGQME